MEENRKNIISIDRPAEDWNEALLIGNGRIGGAVYGTIDNERIDLSEITFFSGNASCENDQDDAHKSFYKMRELICDDNYKEAKEISKNFIGKRLNYGTNLPVGSIYIRDTKGDESEKVSEYKRTLDIMHGIADVQYVTNNVKVTREYFASNDDNCIYGKIKCSKKQQLSCNIGFEGYEDNWKSYVENDQYCFVANAREKKHSDGTTGVNLSGCIDILRTDGKILIADDGITINNASEIIFTISMETDYKGQIDRESLLNKYKEYEYEAAKVKHINEISEFMSRVDVSLGEADNQLELMFQYGRYLLLSSSRKNSPSPAHLQGIWNDNVACKIGWTCDMHLDINTQMNYWLSLEGNLDECSAPVFKWIEDSLVPSGRITAKKSYNLGGWVAELVSNIWGFSAPYWSPNISPCPTGGIWTISQYWEYYLHTEDKVFLKKRAYPIIKEAAEFFVDYVFECDGYYSSGPSISPENMFKIGDENYSFSNGSTYEILMIRELFIQYIEIVKILGVEGDLKNRIEDILPKLLPYRIASDGCLAEWSHDYPSHDLQHRHTSHLLGLYPYNQITIEKTPELVEAIKKTIAKKLTPYDKWEDTGWARTLLTLYSARLADANQAYFHLDSIRENLTSVSMLVMHPPTRGAASFKEVYELDGNTGFSMCVIEMLVQSHDDVIRLLPALPTNWKDGHLTGIKVRGNITVDLYWTDSKLKKVILNSSKTKSVSLEYEGSKKSVLLEGNVPFAIDDFNTIN